MALALSRRQAIRAIVVVVILAAALGVRLRISRDWVLAGADSYGYMQLADEMRRDGRYALGPPPEPLAYARPPGYPLVLAALIVPDKPTWFRTSSENWLRMQDGQSILEVLALGLLVFAIARRFGGFASAVTALLLVLFWPTTLVMSNMILAEWLATILTLASLGLLVAAGHVRWRWFAVGVLVGAAFLVRIDSVLLVAPCLAGVALVRGWRARALFGALVLAGFTVVVTPWALRNIIRFGSPHLVVTGMDYQSRPVPTVGFREWMATWAHGADELKKFEFCFTRRSCMMSIEKFPAEAFASADERETVRALLLRHNREGFTSDVSDGFQKVASERRHRQALRTVVWLPITRSVRLWLTPADDLFKRRRRPWPALFDPLGPQLHLLSWLLAIGSLLSLVVLAIDRRMRQLAIVAGTAIVFRTLALGYAYYPEPRYLFEVIPIALIVITLAGSVVATAIRARASKREDRAAIVDG